MDEVETEIYRRGPTHQAPVTDGDGNRVGTELFTFLGTEERADGRTEYHYGVLVPVPGGPGRMAERIHTFEPLPEYSPGS